MGIQADRLQRVHTSDMPNMGGSNHESYTNRRFTTFDKETQPLDKLRFGFTGLPIIDKHMFKDLKIFDTESDAKGLFERCNFTRTGGGSMLLRQRFESPWCEPDRIKSTRLSVAFIKSHREIFAKLPTYIVQSIESYQREIFMGITKKKISEFYIQSTKEPLINVCEAVSARQRSAKKRSLQVINAHFELIFNAAITT